MLEITPEMAAEIKKDSKDRYEWYDRALSVGRNIDILNRYHHMCARYDAEREFYRDYSNLIPDYEELYSDIYVNRDTLHEFYLSIPNYYMFGPDEAKSAVDFVVQALMPNIFAAIGKLTSRELQSFDNSFTQMWGKLLLDDLFNKHYDNWGYTLIDDTRDRHKLFLKYNKEWNNPQMPKSKIKF